MCRKKQIDKIKKFLRRPIHAFAIQIIEENKDIIEAAIGEPIFFHDTMFDQTYIPKYHPRMDLGYPKYHNKDDWIISGTQGEWEDVWFMSDEEFKAKYIICE